MSLQACSPKQVMLDVANAEGRGTRTNADTDQPWRHLLSPCGPAVPPEPAAVRPPAAPSTRTGGGPDAGAGGGGGVSVERPGRAPRRAAHEHAVKVPRRRELTPPRRSASAQPVPEPLLDVAVVHSGFAATMRAANGDLGAGAARAARAAQAVRTSATFSTWALGLHAHVTPAPQHSAHLLLLYLMYSFNDENHHILTYTSSHYQMKVYIQFTPAQQEGARRVHATTTAQHSTAHMMLTTRCCP